MNRTASLLPENVCTVLYWLNALTKYILEHTLNFENSRFFSFTRIGLKLFSLGGAKEALLCVEVVFSLSDLQHLQFSSALCGIV